MKDERKCYRMRVPTCGSIIMTELYSKSHRITGSVYDMIIMEKSKQAIKVDRSLMSICDIVIISQ